MAARSCNAELASVARDFPGLVLATALDARKSLYDCYLTGAVAFIIGNEGAGVTPSLLEAVSETVLIPMPGGTESLNAGVAAAIIALREHPGGATAPRPGAPASLTPAPRT